MAEELGGDYVVEEVGEEDAIAGGLEADEEDVAALTGGTKRALEGSEGEEGEGSAADALSAQERKRLRRLKERQKKKKKYEDRQQAVSELVACGAEGQAEMVTAFLQKELSADGVTKLELATFRLAPANMVVPPEGTFKLPHDLCNIQAWLKAVMPEWEEALTAKVISRNMKKKKSKEGKEFSFGSPVVLLLTSSGARSVELIRALPDIGKLGKVAKLFAKHFKVEEQQQFLQTNASRCAVGTPNRLMKLAELGSLDFGKLRLLLIDGYRDGKQRTIFENPEVRGDLVKLFRVHLQQEVRKGSLKLSVF